MELSLLGIILGLVLFFVPMCFFQVYGLRFFGKAISSFVFMTIKFAVLGVALYFMFKWNNAIANVLFVIIVMAVSAVSVGLKAHLSLRHHFVPLFSGMAVAVLTLGAWLLWGVMGGIDALASSRIIPVVGLLCGGVLEIEGKAITFYYMGLRNHNDIYYYVLGNGATRIQALFYFRKRAMERTATHFIRLVSASVFTSVPVLMWALLLGGVGVITAVALQLVVVCAMFSAAMMSVSVTLIVAAHYSMDGYGRLKGSETKEAVGDTLPEAHTADVSRVSVDNAIVENSTKTETN